MSMYAKVVRKAGRLETTVAARLGTRKLFDK
jgi:hypothetical protein